MTTPPHITLDEHMAEDARLVILKELKSQVSQSLNETILSATLDLYGHRRSREWLRTQLRKLAELGAVKVQEAGSVMIATLTRAGLDHLDMRSVIEGIRRPSPEA
jgi:DNA-binding GntR family transcriptional regulator